jgi:lipoprotein NlpD
VKRGDTLYLIALDHGLDYRELAAWNGIENVNLIRVGQVLRLSAPGDVSAAGVTTPGGVVTAPLRTVPPVTSGGAAGAAPGGSEPRPPSPGPVVSSRHSDTYKTQPKAIKEPYSERALREMQRAAAAPAPSAPAPAGGVPDGPPAAPPAVIARVEPKLEAKPEPKAEPLPTPSGSAEDDDKLDWLWPATGKLVTGFSDNANLKGIDIAGKVGQPVLASAGGKVVYAGSGLRGYGKLIIIKHNKNYLSAYAHNKDILVKEGQQVARGQKIAEMGNTDADQVKLHFEIRRLGKPMDPLKYLPPA